MLRWSSLFASAISPPSGSSEHRAPRIIPLAMHPPCRPLATAASHDSPPPRPVRALARQGPLGAFPRPDALRQATSLSLDCASGKALETFSFDGPQRHVTHPRPRLTRRTPEDATSGARRRAHSYLFTSSHASCGAVERRGRPVSSAAVRCDAAAGTWMHARSRFHAQRLECAVSSAASRHGLPLAHGTEVQRRWPEQAVVNLPECGHAKHRIRRWVAGRHARAWCPISRRGGHTRQSEALAVARWAREFQDGEMAVGKVQRLPSRRVSLRIRICCSRGNPATLPTRGVWASSGASPCAWERGPPTSSRLPQLPLLSSALCACRPHHRADCADCSDDFRPVVWTSTGGNPVCQPAPALTAGRQPTKISRWSSLPLQEIRLVTMPPGVASLSRRSTALAPLHQTWRAGCLPRLSSSPTAAELNSRPD
ncbi:hypothetical protein EJ04DRAFT_529141 [Polyplosphaeria fusca]|uniref:Uncharacterized protein n=1 Tax=Polyplosphaeria fusca TaxID=682080 RepID=A0A9P4QN11_9PLEO|nr:hypothetical protein EJ04DRAFT_529141 [Polyplosphaeria fusca]